MYGTLVTLNGSECAIVGSDRGVTGVTGSFVSARRAVEHAEDKYGQIEWVSHDTFCVRLMAHLRAQNIPGFYAVGL